MKQKIMTHGKMLNLSLKWLLHILVPDNNLGHSSNYFPSVFNNLSPSGTEVCGNINLEVLVVHCLNFLFHILAAATGNNYARDYAQTIQG